MVHSHGNEVNYTASPHLMIAPAQRHSNLPLTQFLNNYKEQLHWFPQLELKNHNDPQQNRGAGGEGEEKILPVQMALPSHLLMR